MHTLEDLAPPLQRLFTDTADEVARESGFVKRRRAFTGSTFFQTCVLTWAEVPAATLEQMTATAASLGVDVATQSLDARLGLPAAEFLRRMLARCLALAFAPRPRALPLLGRFSGVYLDDCTHVALPAALAGPLPGCGGSTPDAGASSLKVLLRWEVLSASIGALEPATAREADTALADGLPPPPAGSLRLADLGFFSLKALRRLDDAGVFFVTKLKHGTALHVAGRRVEGLAAWLDGRGKGRVDRRAVLGGSGGKARVCCRLVAWRVGPEAAARRREKAIKDGRDKGYEPSPEALALCGWLVLVTNVPRERLCLSEVAEVCRVRWQVELVFKAWKSDLLLDEWRTRRPGRVLAEVYGKLIAAVALSWLALLAWADGPAKSVRRVLKAVRGLAVRALGRLVEAGPEAMAAALRRARPGLRRVGRLPRRRKGKGTFQALEDAAGRPDDPADCDLEPLS